MSERTVLAGGDVLLADGSIAALDVVVGDGRIVALHQGAAGNVAGAGTIDVGGALVAPGFIDLQINGGWGSDFTSDPSTIADVASRLPATGVTAFLPTVVTSSVEVRREALTALRELAASDRGGSAAVPLGLHFEGPAIASERAGAHDPRWIGRPSPDELAGWTRSNGVAMVTLAAEGEGADELIAALAAAGVVVSLGHSACSAEQYAQAVAAGATMVTHLYNAMAPFNHRQPGLVGAALAGDTFAGLICDGIHVDPVAVRVAWRALGRRIVLVTDAMAALGVELEATRLGELAVTVDETGVRTPDGVLAGSNLSMDKAVRNLIGFTGCSVAEAIGAATATPAGVIGLTDRGRIEVGARADLVVLDRELTVAMTMIGGAVAWRS